MTCPSHPHYADYDCKAHKALWSHPLVMRVTGWSAEERAIKLIDEQEITIRKQKAEILRLRNEMKPKPFLRNGQIWEQRGFPYNRCMVLMLGLSLGVQLWCRVALIGLVVSSRPPLVITEPNGAWSGDEEEILRRLSEAGYTLIGIGSVVVQGET